MRAWRATQRSTVTLNLTSRRAFARSRFLSANRSIAATLRDGADAEKVSVTGWVRSVRRQKRVAFAVVGDGSTVDSLQAVLKPEDASNLSHGTAVKLTGEWKASVGSGQSHELQVKQVRVLGENDAESNPLQPKYQSPEYLRTVPHLRARIPANALVLRLRSDLINSLSNYFNSEDFVQIHTPTITSSDCEGAGEVFTIDPSEKAASADGAEKHFFKSPKYLTVSAQLHLEAMAQAVNKVWTLSPTFRAEHSDTSRHLAEFYMLEAEMCFVQDLNEILDLVENMLRNAVTGLRQSRTYSELMQTKQNALKEDIESDDRFVDAIALQSRWDGIIARQWPRITYAEAIEMLKSAHISKDASFASPPSYDDGLQAEHERFIASTTGNGKPVFVTDYPRAQKPFYMPPSTSTSSNEDLTGTVACFDLLVPDLCELAGGSLREHRSKELLKAMRSKRVAGNNLDWYQDLRKYGSVPHGGFGLGFDRLLCYLAGVNNVRDVVAFPRWYGRCDC